MKESSFFTHRDGRQSERSLRQSPSNSLTALVLLHRAVESASAMRRYRDYNISSVIKAPMLPAESSGIAFEPLEATIKRFEDVLGGKIPDIIVLDPNYSFPGSAEPNIVLLDYLIKTYENTKFVLVSATKECLEATCKKYAGSVDMVSINLERQVDPMTNRFSEERELILRAKDRGRSASVNW